MPIAPTATLAHDVFRRMCLRWADGDNEAYLRWRADHPDDWVRALRQHAAVWQTAAGLLPLEHLSRLWEEPGGAWRAPALAPRGLAEELAGCGRKGEEMAGLWAWAGQQGIPLDGHDTPRAPMPQHRWTVSARQFPPVVQALLRGSAEEHAALVRAGADPWVRLEGGRTAFHVLFEAAGSYLNPPLDLDPMAAWTRVHRALWGDDGAFQRPGFWLSLIAAHPERMFDRDAFGRSPWGMALQTQGDHTLQKLVPLVHAAGAPALRQWAQEEGRCQGGPCAWMPVHRLRQALPLTPWFALLDQGLPADASDEEGTGALGLLLSAACEEDTRRHEGWLLDAVLALRRAGANTRWGWKGASVWTPLLSAPKAPLALAEALAEGEDLSGHCALIRGMPCGLLEALVRMHLTDWIQGTPSGVELGGRLIARHGLRLTQGVLDHLEQNSLMHHHAGASHVRGFIDHWRAAEVQGALEGQLPAGGARKGGARL